MINGGIMGAGAGKRLSAVRWGVAGNIVLAWLLTMPCAAVIGAATYLVTNLFGDGAAGPVVVSLVALLMLATGVYVRREQQRQSTLVAG